MTKNMGQADRLLRAALGVVLLAFAVFGSAGTVVTAIAAILGLVMLGTSVMGYCPLYAPFGVRTCKD